MNVSIQAIQEYLQSFTEVFALNLQARSFDEVRLFLPDLPSYSASTLYVASEEAYTAFAQREDAPTKAQHITVVCPGEKAKLSAVKPMGLCLFGVVPNIDLFDLFNRMQDLFSQYTLWERKLDRAIYVEKNLQSVVDEGNAMLKHVLLVWDTNFNILAYSKLEEIESPNFLNMLDRRFFTEEIVEHILQDKLLATPVFENTVRVLTQEETYSGTAFYIRHYFTKYQRSYSAALVTNGNPISAGEYQTLCCFFKKFDEFLHVALLGSNNDNLFEGLLRSMITGSLTEQEQVLRRASAFGLNIEEPYMFYVIGFSHFSTIKAQFMADHLRASFPSAAIILQKEYLYMLKPIRAYPCATEDAVERFKNLLNSYNALCGVSNQILIAQFQSAYIQATKALSYGRLIKKYNPSLPRVIFSYSRHAITHMLDCYKQEMGDFQALLPPGLSQMLENSKEDDSNIRLLMTYLKNGRSPSLCAQVMNLHRNTVVYRLNRIREKYNIDLENYHSLMNVLLMLRVYEFENMIADTDVEEKEEDI